MLALLLVLMVPSPAAALAPVDVTGTWEVRTKPSVVNTCGTGTDADIYQWVVSDRAGSITVQVTTKTGYPAMSGSHKDGRLFVFGVGAGTPRSTAFFEVMLDASGAAFTGRRVLSTDYNGQNCTVEYTATGRRL